MRRKGLWAAGSGAVTVQVSDVARRTAKDGDCVTHLLVQIEVDYPGGVVTVLGIEANRRVRGNLQQTGPVR